MKSLRLFHGSPVAVPVPDIVKCRPNNDYGQGFYCTEDEELAKEWACQRGVNGFANAYSLPLGGLHVIDLNGPDFCILNWMAVLMGNRICRASTPTMLQGVRWIGEHFAVDLSSADVVTGYRADDSYFSFTRAFLRNEITLEQLNSAFRLGKLGVQHMVKSPAAFERLKFEGATPVDASEYWARRQTREDQARASFAKLVGGTSPANCDSPYIVDLMRMEEGELHACLF